MGASKPTLDMNLQLREENERLKAELATLKTRGKMTLSEQRQSLDKILEKYGVHPVEELVRLAVSKKPDGTDELSKDQQIRIWTEIAQYQVPKLKSVEQHSQVDHTHTIIIRRFGDKALSTPKTIDIPSERVREEVPDGRN